MATLLPSINIGPLTWKWSRTCLLGVINVTPDSFYDGGRYIQLEAAVDRGMELVHQGTDILDIGGESTRPGSEPITAEEELERVIPVIRELAYRTDIPISVDTYKARVAHYAVQEGARVINDISGLRIDPDMADVVAKTGAAIILGHLRGHPKNMQQKIFFKNVVEEVTEELRGSIQIAILAGVKPDRIWVDPGIGFGKTTDQSLTLLRAIGQIREELGYPIMVGLSRKSFIGEVTGLPPDDRLWGTCGAVTTAISLGVDGVRVHDVGELLPAIRVCDAIRYGLIPEETVVVK